MYRTNCSLFWHEKQHISVDAFIDYGLIGSNFRCELSGGLSSSLHDITSLSASIKHHHNATRVDSSVRVAVRFSFNYFLDNSAFILKHAESLILFVNCSIILDK